MKFLEIVKKLQTQNEGYIVIVQNGIFFIGIGKDAIILNEILGLKLTCMTNEICKVGFQVKNVEKYIAKLNTAQKSYVLYAKNEKGQLEEIYRFDGEKTTETKNCKDCNICESRPVTEKEIIERVKKLGQR